MNRRTLTLAMAGLLCAAMSAQAQPRTAVAAIRGCTEAAITGRAQLAEIPSQEGVKQVLVELTVRGLPDGKHGVHIHETANCTPCAAAGGHFDPGPASDPSPDGNHPFHSGDLVNIDVHGGYGVLLTLTGRGTLAPGPLSIFDKDGSALIIHENPDTYCPQGDVHDCAGAAGRRVASSRRLRGEAFSGGMLPARVSWWRERNSAGRSWMAARPTSPGCWA